MFLWTIEPMDSVFPPATRGRYQEEFPEDMLRVLIRRRGSEFRALFQQT